MTWQELAWDSAEERALFVAEARELLDALEAQALAETPDVAAAFRAAHTLKGSAGLVGLSAWVDPLHALEDQLAAVRQGTAAWDAALRDAALATVDRIRRDLDGAPGSARPRVTVTCAADCPMPGARAFQALAAVRAEDAHAQSDPPDTALPAWTGRVFHLETTLPAARVRALLAPYPDLQVTDDPDAEDAAPPGDAASAAGPPAHAAGGDPTLRIPARILEDILGGLGEVLLDQSQLAHRWGPQLDADGRAVLDHLRRQALAVQEQALRARMLPLNTLFRQYPRAVHDLARQLGKAIRLETEGGDTELDRLVMDRLHEPLLHLIRNACDHGIEPPAARRAAGKPETGTLRLRAWTATGKVHVAVSDDGAGIDWEAIRAKAVRTGRLSPDAAAQATPERLQALLFEPGFSTRDAVTAVSGRGVGLDAIAAFCDAVHGTITLESTPGRGATFHLELPLTLAIQTALLVAAGPWVIGLPALSVTRIEPWDAAQARTALGTPAVDADAGPEPQYVLAHRFDPAAATTPAFQVRVRDGAARAALLVDHVLGQVEVVVQPQPLLARRAPWLAGVALLGDGRLAFIADVRRLVPAHGAGAPPAADDGILRPGSNQLELLVFRLAAGPAYGLNVYKTREVLAAPPVTPVAGQHAWLDGFLRLRGETVPVVSLARALDQPPGDAPVVLVTEFNQTLQAFPVATVERLVRVSWEAVQRLPDVLQPPSRAHAFVGLVDHPEFGPILLPDFERILDTVRPPAFPPPAAEPAPRRAGGQVWLADDSKVARHQVVRALQPLGVAVREFEDGQALWEAVAAGDALPDAFVLDVEMPRLDGYTLTVRLKQDPRTQARPVILHTSLSGHWHAARASAVDADAVLTKFDAARLARAVAALLPPTTAPIPAAEGGKDA